MSLYEITGRLAALRDMIDQEMISEEDAADTMDAILQEQEDGYENAVKWIKDMDAEMDAIKAESDRLAEKRKTLESRKERVKKAILRSMVASGQKKVKAGIFSISMRNFAPSIVPSVDLNSMPDEFLKITKEFSATSAKEWMKKNGESQYFYKKPGKTGIVIS